MYWTLLNPSVPPCKWFGAALGGTLYTVPSMVNLALAILLAQRPTEQPKYGGLVLYTAYEIILIVIKWINKLDYMHHNYIL